MKILAIALLMIVLPLPLLAQRTGGSVTGHVFDPSGAPIPGATVTAKRIATGTVNTTQSNAVGLYQFPFLPVGTYQFSFSKAGFKTYHQSGVTLQIAQNAIVDAHLQLGTQTQSISVTANASMLNTSNGSASWSISSERVAAIPVRNMNTIIATWFAPGVTVTSGARNIRPFDTSGTQHENIAGGQSGGGGFGGRPGQPGGTGNMVQVDGVSANNHIQGVGFNPIAQTVQQVQVLSTMYDAQYGWTTGGVINTITKGGTNTWHGMAYEYIQNTILNARTWQEAYTNIPRGAWHQNYFGGQVGGPVLKNKLFAFIAYQKILQVQPDYNTGSVPTPAMKAGDFSGLLNSSGDLVPIYIPTSVCGYGNNPACALDANNNPIYARTQTFQGNIIPTASSPVAGEPNQNPVGQAMLAYIPDPTSFTTANPNGDQYTHLNNWITNNNRKKFIDSFPQWAGRLDYNLSDKTHMFFRYGWNSLAETRGFAYSFVGQPYNLAETSGNVPFGRQNDDWTLEMTHTFNPTTVLQLRTGMDRFKSISGSNISAGFNLGSLGFDSQYVGQAASYFPIVRFATYEGLGSTPGGINPSDLTYTNEVILAKTLNKQNWRIGFQNYNVGQNRVNPGASAGYFIFNGNYTTEFPLAQNANSGNPIADILLGVPEGGFIQRLSSPKLMMHLWSIFAQDDIRLNSKLTVTAGIRWSYQGGLTDRFDALLGGFCTTCSNPVSSPLLPIVGGVEYAGVGSNPRGIVKPSYGNFAPRFGFAYRVRPDTVVRGGVGIIYAGVWYNPGAAPGFAQTTGIVGPEFTGIPVTSLTNPFPNGVLSPSGSTYGLAQQVGRGVSFTDPNARTPQTFQYSLDVQHEFAQNWRLSAQYVGSVGRRMPVSRALNFLSTQALALGTAGLTANVPNPFYQIYNLPQNLAYTSLLQGTFFRNETVQASQLMLPFPAYGGITENYIPIGTTKYNAMWLDLNKRMSHGLDFDINFDWSKTMQKTQFLNAQDPSPSWFLSPWDSPEQIKFTGVWQLPFGHGREFMTNAGPVVNRIVEGWQVSGETRWQAGFPIPFPRGVAPTGKSVKYANRNLSQWFNTCTVIDPGTQNVSFSGNCGTGTVAQKEAYAAWTPLQPYQLEQWSPYLPNLRGPRAWETQISAQKNTTIKERYKLTFRADFTNAFNTPDWAYGSVDNYYASGTFGQYAPRNNPSNNPRVIMLSLQLVF